MGNKNVITNVNCKSVLFKLIKLFESIRYLKRNALLKKIGKDYMNGDINSKQAVLKCLSSSNNFGITSYELSQLVGNDFSTIIYDLGNRGFTIYNKRDVFLGQHVTRYFLINL